jgi:uncharacterized protein YjiS (DUF1127 family)
VDDLTDVLAAVDRGESVIAVNEHKKTWYPWKPYQETRATPDQIRAWAKDQRCAGFAVITGAISGLMVGDFDVPDGVVLCEELKLRPHVRTPSGGGHVRFGHPGFPVKTQNSEVTKRLQERWHGLDVRGDGGYAVEWGRNTQGEYRALRELSELEDLDQLPDQLLADLGISENGAEPDVAAQGTGIPEPATEPDERVKIRHPGRYAHLFHLGCAMRGRGEDDKAILKELRRVNKAECEPPKPDDAVAALAKDVAARYEPDGDRFEVTWTKDKTPKLILPRIPDHEDTEGLCGWLTSVFRLDSSHPVVGAVHQGLRGPDGQVEVRRRNELSIRFEPAGIVSTARRLLTQLGWQLQPTDGEPYGFRDEHARRIAHVLRLLCGLKRNTDERDIAEGVVIEFMSDAEELEGYTTYGTTAQRYEAACALRGEVSEATGRMIGLPRYLVDENTGEYVVRAGDLQRAARIHTGTSLPNGWVDARMELIGWKRIVLEGHSLPGRKGRETGHHARCKAYRGLLPGGDDDESVNT